MPFIPQSKVLHDEPNSHELYKRSCTGEIKNYTGTDSPYEVPVKSVLTNDAEQLSIEESLKRVVHLFTVRGVTNLDSKPYC